jgi:transposase
MKKGQAPPRYDAAFKEGAMKLVTEQGRSSREAATDLGISVDTLRSWLKSKGVNPGENDRGNRDARRLKELEAQNRDLRKQVTEKDEVIAVLKKSVGILSRP